MVWCTVLIFLQFISSDHKPMLVTFEGLTTQVRNTASVIDSKSSRILPNWSKADDVSLLQYEQVLSAALKMICNDFFGC